MTPDIAEAVGKFTEMDRRLLVVRRLHRCVKWLWVPAVATIAMFSALAYRASNWESMGWAVLGCVSSYVIASVGKELCSIAMKLLQLNLDECKAMGGEEKP